MRASSIVMYLLQTSAVLAASWGPPSASISWDNLKHIRVYSVDPNGVVKEWGWDDTGSWNGPFAIGAQAKPGTVVTAINDGTRIRVYYQDVNDRARERVHDNGWRDGALLP